MSAIPARAREGWSLLRKTIEIWTSGHAFQWAGALAFYTLFSLAPLFIILITITGLLFGEEAARGEISAQLEQYVGPQAADAVQDAVSRARISESGILPTLLGVGALLFGATTVFAQMQAALNQLWGVASRPSRSGIIVFVLSRLASLGLVLMIGFLLLVSFVLSMAIAALLSFAEHLVPLPSFVVSAVDLLFSLAIATALFATIFKVLPDVRLAWRGLWQGAFLTAVFFVLGQFLISLYLSQTAPESTYGAAGALVLLLMWVYYSSLVIFLGAAFTKASIERRGGRFEPKPTAVRMRTMVYEEEEDGTARRVESSVG